MMFHIGNLFQRGHKNYPNYLHNSVLNVTHITKYGSKRGYYHELGHNHQWAA